MKAKFRLLAVCLVTASFSNLASAENNSLASIDIGKIVMESCKDSPKTCDYYKQLHAGLTGRIQSDENAEQNFIDETKKIESMLNAQFKGYIKSEDVVVAKCSKMDDSGERLIVTYDENCLARNYKEVSEICKSDSLSKEVGLYDYCRTANL